MKTSVIIPVLNEDPIELRRMLENLIYDASPEDIEVIIVNDGSTNSDGEPIDVEWENIPFMFDDDSEYDFIIINNKERHGVGYSFDLGVRYASGDTIVLCGSDVYPERGKWLKSLENMVSDGIIACGASVGLQPGNYDINEEGLYYRYGAKIIYKMNYEDLPKSSPIKDKLDKNGIKEHRDILEAKWLTKLDDKPYEIPCVYGAFYAMKRNDYLRMGGFDTKEGQLFMGHKYWGCLEPYLSLKARVYGIKCMMFPDFRVGHLFGRLTNNAEGIRSVRDDYKWWNKLFVAHTMFDNELRDDILAHPRHSLNLSLAQAYIKRNWDTVCEIRNRNKREGNLITEI